MHAKSQAPGLGFIAVKSALSGGRNGASPREIHLRRVKSLGRREIYVLRALDIRPVLSYNTAKLLTPKVFSCGGRCAIERIAHPTVGLLAASKKRCGFFAAKNPSGR